MKDMSFEEELNKSLTQEEKDLLQPDIREIKEEMEKLNRMVIEEYYELIEEEKILQTEFDEELEKLNHCKNEDEEEYIRDVIKGIKRDIQRNVGIQSRFHEKVWN